MPKRYSVEIPIGAFLSCMLYESLTDSPAVIPADPPASSFLLRRANLLYCGTLLLFTSLSSLLFYTGPAWLGKVVNSAYDAPVALGTSLVARTTSSLALFFAAHCALTFANANLADSRQFVAHVSLPWLHALLSLPLWVGFWFAPDGFFDAYLAAAPWISGLCLTVQAFFVIDLFQYLNARLLHRAQLCLMGSLTAALAAAAAAAFGVFYWLFAAGGAGVALITVNLCLCAALWVLAALVEHASVMTASFVALLPAAGIDGAADAVAAAFGVFY
jgi:hypothetical protein